MCRCTGYRPTIEAFHSVDSKNSPTMMIPTEILAQMKSLSSSPFSSTSGDMSWSKPTSISETVQLMTKHPDYYLRCGGTGNYKKFNEEKKQSHVIDISGVAELKNITKTDFELEIGAGVTFTQLLHFLENNDINCSFISELIVVLRQLATPQVRNVASVGGTLLWDHPASDLTPLLLAAAAQVTLVAAGQSEVTLLSLADLVSRKIQRGELLVSIRVDLNSTVYKFYKHARRNTADLAIANMTIAYRKSEWKIYIGGIGLAVKDCPQRKVVHAYNLGNLLSSRSYSLTALKSISSEEICSAAELDLKCDSDVSSLEKMAFRVSLVHGFVVKFIENINRVGTKRDATEFKFHQLYEKTPDDQEPMDPVTRPVPHVSAAEQCSGL